MNIATNNYQRKGAKSNAHVGKNFERLAFNYFSSKGYTLSKDFGISIGYNKKKIHKFDLGGKSSNGSPFLVECKSHKWTESGNVPSAKLTVWNEAMHYFSLVSTQYKKCFFVLRDFSNKRNETLAEYYLRQYGHLVPGDVSILEYNVETNAGKIINPSS